MNEPLYDFNEGHRTEEQESRIMKKLITIFFCVLIIACGRPQTDDTEHTALPETEIREDTGIETETAVPALASELTDEPAGILEFLDGTWNLRTNQAETDVSAALSFRKESGTVQIHAADDLSVVADLEVFDSDSESGITGDAIRFSVTDAADGLIQKYGDNLDIYSSDMQYFTGTFEGTDYLFLRELGNGMSVIDMAVLKEENETGEYGWIFTREESPFAASDDNDDEFIKNGTCYAFCWMKDASGFLLQRAEVIGEIADWYGEEMNIVRVIPSVDHGKLYLYNTDTVPKSFSPGLYRVTVDSEGTVTQAEPVVYIGYGAYRKPEE